MSPKLGLKFSPLTSARWRDLETLFGAKGACGGCWCMYWRLRRSQFDNQKGEGNRKAMKKIVDSEEVPGILAYSGREPVAWCSVAPRETYPTLDRSRVLKRVDEQPVWSIVCLFVAKPWRRKGVTVELLRAAADYAKRQGARILEGYPVEPKKDSMPDAFAWTGLASAFRKAGFTEVLRRSETRPIMRRVLQHESRESAARTAPSS
jgi:GNAT superfamily N-acetyltransferase